MKEEIRKYKAVLENGGHVENKGKPTPRKNVYKVDKLL